MGGAAAMAHPARARRRGQASFPPPPASSIVRGDPVLDHGRDALAPFGAVEDAVMADTLGEMVFLEPPRQPRGDVERVLGLADAGNVVALPFDGEQADIDDRGRVHAL